MRKVFYSFHYSEDVMRVMMIRNMGVIEDEETVQPNPWEQVRRTGEGAIKSWIDKTMDKCSCVVVLIGEHTSQRKWVQYEIERAWNTGKGLFGIYIHNLNPVNRVIPMYGERGENPFSHFTVKGIRILPFGQESPSINLSKIVPVYDPNRYDAYNEIKLKMSSWVEEAILVRQRNSPTECRKEAAQIPFLNLGLS